MRSPREHRLFLESLAAKVPNPQAGFFGPGSMAWRLSRELVLGLVVLRALFLQVAHPKIAQGVAEHSDFRRRPFARAYATFKAQQRIVFGTCDEAIDALVRIYARHTVISGDSYRANDPSLLFWVYATLIDSMFFAYRTFLPDLTAAEWARFYEEGKLFASLIGIPAEQVPPRLADFNAWMQAAISSDEITVSPVGREIGRSLLRMPVGLAASLNAILAGGTLPPKLRQQFGIRWSLRRQKWFNAFAASIKWLMRVTPQFLHTAPVYWTALHRAKGSAPST
ncbi:MAG: oxygenase MpaB family protein [Anaerolineales bacterium]